MKAVIVLAMITASVAGPTQLVEDSEVYNTQDLVGKMRLDITHKFADIRDRVSNADSDVGNTVSITLTTAGEAIYDILDDLSTVMQSDTVTHDDVKTSLSEVHNLIVNAEDSVTNEVAQLPEDVAEIVTDLLATLKDDFDELAEKFVKLQS